MSRVMFLGGGKRLRYSRGEGVTPGVSAFAKSKIHMPIANSHNCKKICIFWQRLSCAS